MNVSEPATSLRAAQAKVAALLNPRNVVIVGASDTPGSWALRAFQNLRRYEFPGAVYAVNPRRDQVWNMRCYGSFAELPEPPDHVVVVIPATAGAGHVARRRCGRSAQRHHHVVGLWRSPKSRRQGARGDVGQNDRRNRACGLRAELHGQHPRAVAADDADRRSPAPHRRRPGGDRRPVRRARHGDQAHARRARHRHRLAGDVGQRSGADDRRLHRLLRDAAVRARHRLLSRSGEGRRAFARRLRGGATAPASR